MTDEPLRILDTGTRPAQTPSGPVEVRHKPALIRRRLDLDATRLEDLTSEPAHLVFYSRFAVRCVGDAMSCIGDKHRLWAVGPKTARVVEETMGQNARYPQQQQFTGLRKVLENCGDPRRIISFGLRGTDRDLSDIAADWNVDFTDIDVYQSVAQAPDQLVEVFEDFEPHWLAVTSSRGVGSLIDALGAKHLTELQSSDALAIAAIGPSTAQTLSDYGLDADLVADTPDRDKMLREIAESTHFC